MIRRFINERMDGFSDHDHQRNPPQVKGGFLPAGQFGLDGGDISFQKPCGQQRQDQYGEYFLRNEEKGRYKSDAVFHGMDEWEKQRCGNRCRQIRQHHVTGQTAGIAAQFLRDDGRGGACRRHDADHGRFCKQCVYRFEDEIDDDRATDLQYDL